MAQIFQKSANKWWVYFIIFVFLGLFSAVFFFWYFGSPNYTDVGYAPQQPIPYSHKVHAGDLNIDCRYCHTGVENSAVAGVPPTQTCMNCHVLVKPESPKLTLLRESWFESKPVQWVKVHKVPDYAYFDHSVHVNAGVGCESCHGNVAAMEVVKQEKSLSMSWCLDCHKDPSPHLRPQSEITTMEYQPPANQLEFAATLIREKDINPPITCSGCHR